MSADQAAKVTHLLTRGVLACETRNLDELATVVIQLTGTLDFCYEAAALALAQMYDRGLREAEQGRFALADAMCRRMLAALGERPAALESERKAR
jgi:hypothetical protein